MKRITITILALFFGNAAASVATLIPTEQLEQYFIDHGIEYETAPSFTRTATSGEYLFVPTRDPLDNETMGIFFELNTGNSLNDGNMHWAMGLRGPHAGNSVNHYGGRGLALGHLPFFDSCGNLGGFIENFTDAELGQGYPQVTYCEPALLFNYSTYRVDIHVSKQNVLVRIWLKQFRLYGGPTYNMIAEYSCVTDDGPNGRTVFARRIQPTVALAGCSLAQRFSIQTTHGPLGIFLWRSSD